MYILSLSLFLSLESDLLIQLLLLPVHSAGLSDTNQGITRETTTTTTCYSHSVRSHDSIYSNNNLQSKQQQQHTLQQKQFLSLF
jgi:hypothetical protein